MTMNAEDRLDFLWKQHSYISEFIKFADAKAAFAATIAIAFISGVLSSNTSFRRDLQGILSAGADAKGVAAGFSLLLMIFSVALSAWCIKPRLRSGKNPCPIAWPDLAKYKTAEDFKEASRVLSPELAAEMLAEQNYHIARVCRRKHDTVAYALIAEFLGGIVAVLLLIVG